MFSKPKKKTEPVLDPLLCIWVDTPLYSQPETLLRSKTHLRSQKIYSWFYELCEIQIRQSNEMEVDVGCVDACHYSNKKLKFHTEWVHRSGLYNGTGNFWQPCCFFGACSEMKDCLYRTVWCMFAQRFTVIKLNGLLEFGFSLSCVRSSLNNKKKMIGYQTEDVACTCGYIALVCVQAFS